MGGGEHGVGGAGAMGPAGEEHRVAVRHWLTYRASSSLQVGIRYSPAMGDIGPLVNWRALRETRTRPAITLGTSSDRVGSEAQTYYVAAAKDLKPLLGLPVAPYVGLLWEEGEKRARIPFGARVTLGPEWAFLAAYDGTAFHPMVQHQWDRYSLTLILVQSREPGISFSTGF